MSENIVSQIFIGIVKGIAGVANSLGYPVASTINGFAGSQLIDVTIGTTLVILIIGVIIWKMVENQAIKIIAFLVLGGVLLTVFSAGLAPTQVLNQTGQMVGQVPIQVG